MIDSPHSRPANASRLRDRWVWLVLAAALFVGPAPLAAQDAGEADARDDEAREPTSRTVVHFEDLGVVSEQGRLVVDYAIAPDDWKRLGTLDLWLQLRTRTERTYPNTWQAYTLPLEERSGRRAFPRWLANEDPDNVQVCLLGTGPTDNLVYGRGYACTARVSLPVEHTRPPDADRTHTFELRYLAGPPYIPYAPWVRPRVPDFQGPFDQLPAP